MRLLYAAALLALAGCSSTPAGPAGPAAGPLPSASTGAGLSAAAKLVCGEEAEEDLAKALGLATAQPLLTDTGEHGISCDYVYPAGTMTLAVADHPSRDAARTAYDSGRGSAATLPGVGDGAYWSQETLTMLRGSDVLTVDVSGLPASFGKPPHGRQDTALLVATTILHCWTDEGV